MTPDELSSPQTPAPSPQPEIATIEIQKSKARFAGRLLIYIFILIVGSALLALWYFETSERGTPDIQKETENLIDEVKKEIKP